MDAAPTTRRAAAKLKTRAAILDAAKAMFAVVGYEATTIRTVASAAGYSTGAVFASFKDKAELYEAIFGHPPITPEQGRQYLLELQALTTARAA